jgi:flagellar biosynthesis GTPase FlhF
MTLRTKKKSKKDGKSTFKTNRKLKITKSGGSQPNFSNPYFKNKSTPGLLPRYNNNKQKSTQLPSSDFNTSPQFGSPSGLPSMTEPIPGPLSRPELPNNRRNTLPNNRRQNETQTHEQQREIEIEREQQIEQEKQAREQQIEQEKQAREQQIEQEKQVREQQIEQEKQAREQQEKEQEEREQKAKEEAELAEKERLEKLQENTNKKYDLDKLKKTQTKLVNLLQTIDKNDTKDSGVNPDLFKEWAQIILTLTEFQIEHNETDWWDIIKNKI